MNNNRLQKGEDDLLFCCVPRSLRYIFLCSQKAAFKKCSFDKSVDANDFENGIIKKPTGFSLALHLSIRFYRNIIFYWGMSVF